MARVQERRREQRRPVCADHRGAAHPVVARQLHDPAQPPGVRERPGRQRAVPAQHPTALLRRDRPAGARLRRHVPGSRLPGGAAAELRPADHDPRSRPAAGARGHQAHDGGRAAAGLRRCEGLHRQRRPDLAGAQGGLGRVGRRRARACQPGRGHHRIPDRAHRCPPPEAAGRSVGGGRRRDRPDPHRARAPTRRP